MKYFLFILLSLFSYSTMAQHPVELPGALIKLGPSSNVSGSSIDSLFGRNDNLAAENRIMNMNGNSLTIDNINQGLDLYSKGLKDSDSSYSNIAAFQNLSYLSAQKTDNSEGVGITADIRGVSVGDYGADTIGAKISAYTSTSSTTLAVTSGRATIDRSTTGDSRKDITTSVEVNGTEYLADVSGKIDLGTIGTTGWSLTGNSITSGTDFFGTTSNNSIYIKTNNTNVAVIDSTGRFGIGDFTTTAPISKIQVKTDNLLQTVNLASGIKLSNSTVPTSSVTRQNSPVLSFDFQGYSGATVYDTKMFMYGRSPIGGIAELVLAQTVNGVTTELGSFNYGGISAPQLQVGGGAFGFDTYVPRVLTVGAGINTPAITLGPSGWSYENDLGMITSTFNVSQYPTGTHNLWDQRLSGTINMSGNTGTHNLWSLYITPTLTNLTNTTFRAIEVTQGNIFFNTTSEGTSVGPTTTIPSSRIFQVAGTTTKASAPFPSMTSAQRTAISSPTVGDMVYQTDGTEGVYIYKSTGWAFAF